MAGDNSGLRVRLPDRTTTSYGASGLAATKLLDWTPVITSAIVAGSTLGAVWLQNRHTRGGELLRQETEMARDLRKERQLTYLAFLNLITLLPHRSVEEIEVGAKDLGARKILRDVLEQLNVLKLIASPNVARDAEQIWNTFVFSMTDAEKAARKSGDQVNSGSYIASLTALMKTPIDELAEVMRADLVHDESPNSSLV